MRPAFIPVLALVIACGDRTVDADESSSSTDGGTTTGSSTLDGPGSTSTGGALDSSETGLCSNGEGEESPKFDVGPLPPACDLFAQDCELGSKCVPDPWIASRSCVPIEPTPVPDDQPCDVAGGDPCGEGSWCAVVDGNGIGVCRPLCTGSFEQPVCAGDALCVIDDESITAYCDVPCDPFEPGVCRSWSCQPTPNGFGCLPTGDAGRDEGCAQHDSCVQGLACAGLGPAEGCCFGTCCTPLCDDLHPCDRGECTPILPPIPEAADVGFCVGAG